MLLSAFGTAGYEVTKKWLLKKEIGLSDFGFLIVSQTVTVILLIFASILMALHGMLFRSANTLSFYGWLGGSVALNLGILILRTRASRFGEASFVAPVQSFTPGLLLIPAFFLEEQVSWQGKFGIMAIMGGNFWHIRAGEPWKGWWKIFVLPLPRKIPWLGWKLPISESQDEGVLNKIRALRSGYGSAILGGGGIICDALMARSGDVIIGLIYKWLSLTIIFALIHLLYSGRKVIREEYLGVRAKLKANKYSLGIIFLCGGSIVIAAVPSMLAYLLAPIAYVGSVNRLSVIFAVILSWIFLHEEKAKVRLGPAFIVTVGAMLITSDGFMGRLLDTIEIVIGN
ncbi:MAG: hypothetical protein G01um101433_310 [Parcubacteria group bacterium Gr01-1014_33]|nr:MAG: hypothetical protein G01um101433_310 [Parcubacteria group bacterium Gr01-1014_33]